ncbi:PREDICTED: slit homolog 3 protein-like [Branchiostoma belcheri]|uniref:Slit homolog 3 protein-like n=1 Tax=Branchiostoma belcheri TaxID=7741 RepID=A0A6P4YD09_BRABE|nr:PREDICTED: slit homolog 3 protein-like [Branchiostoma belcheri]
MNTQSAFVASVVLTWMSACIVDCALPQGCMKLPPARQLKNLTSLNLRWDDIEIVDWLQLRNLPAIEYLQMAHNKISHVNLGVVIKYLPNLGAVDFSSNRIKSGITNNGCEVTESIGNRKQVVSCAFVRLKLKTLPLESEIPANVFHLHALFNDFANLTYIPHLPNLQHLDLKFNNIETVSWMSLRNMPSLAFLYLSFNRISHVDLSEVIKNLTKLQFVDLSSNMITSVSERQLGLPFIKQVNLNHNPFRCDCAMLWLMEKLKCLQGHCSS